MNKYLLLVLSLVVSCTGNNTVQNKEPIKIVNEFSEDEVKWFKSKGDASINGIAKFKSKAGVLQFGDKFRIELMPYCSYTEERLNKIYKNNDSGFVYIEEGIPKFTPDPKGYHETIKVMCNSQGEFKFNNLPKGEYYVIAFMLWDGTGGGIMRHLTLEESESKFIEMSNF